MNNQQAVGRVSIGVAFLGLLVLVSIMAYSAWAAEPAAAGSKGTLLVIATRIGNDGIRNWLVDPQLAVKFRKEGWKIEERGLAEVTLAHLRAADVTIFIQQPYATNLRGVKALERFGPIMDEYLQSGGGVIIFVDDYYFQMLPMVNRLMKPYGLEVLKERLLDKTPGRMKTLANSPEIEILHTTALADHPITRGVGELWLPLGPNGECTFPLKTSPKWQTIVRGEKTTRSVATWTDDSSSYAESPPVVAARTVGDGGRLVVISTQSSFTLLNGYHPRWDNGFFLRNGMGQLIRNAMDWAAAAPAQPKGVMPATRPVSLKSQESSAFRSVPPADQAPPGRWQKGTVVLVDRQPADLAAWRKALEGKLDWVALAIPGKGLDKSGYERWRAQCRAASDSRLAFIPGMQIVDSFDNRAVILVPKKWPVTRRLRSLCHISHDVNGHIILLQPDDNPWPAWNIGGFWGYALATYRNGKLEDWPIETYRKLQAQDWFVVPHTVDTAVTPEQLAAACEGSRLFTYIGADDPTAVSDALPQQLHNCRDIFVSAGAKIRQFAMTGPSLIDDMYEGLYYLWAGPDDRGTLVARIDSDRPLREVRIYRDGILWRKYRPGTRNWKLRLKLQSDEASHSFWLEAKDQQGNMTVSTTVRTRSLHYWSHGGGDRMNTYAALRVPDKAQEMVIRGQPMATAGGVFFGLGWGAWLRLVSPQLAYKTIPVGREWGSPTFGIANILPVPRITIGRRSEYAVAKPQRVGYELANEQVAVLSEFVDRLENTADPKRPAVAAELIKAKITYTIPRWWPNGMLVVLVDLKVWPIQPLILGQPTELQVLKMVGNRQCRYANLSVWRDGKADRMSIATAAARKGVEAGEGSLIWPDPMGSIGVFSLKGEAMTVRITSPKARPQFRWTVTIPAGTWKPQTPVTLRYAIVYDAGDEKYPEPYFTRLAGLWRGKTAARGVTLTRGRLKSAAGVLDIACKDGLAGGTIDLPAVKAPMLIRLHDLSDRRPLAWRDTAGGKLLPIISRHGTAYYSTQPGQPVRFLAGELVSCSSDMLQIDVCERSVETLALWVHNPTDTTIEANIQPTSLWGEARARKAIKLAPGEETLVTFSITTPTIRRDEAETPGSRVLFEDDFESGGFSKPVGAKASWKITPARPEKDLVVDVQDNVALDGDHSARLTDNTTRKTCVAVAVFQGTSGTNRLSLSFVSRVEKSSATNNNIVTLRKGFQPVVQLRWYDNDKLQYLNARGGWSPCGSYAPGAKERYRIELDEGAKTFSLWVNDKRLLRDVSLGDRTGGGIDRLSFDSGIMASSRVTWYLDDVRLAVHDGGKQSTGNKQ